MAISVTVYLCGVERIQAPSCQFDGIPPWVVGRDIEVPRDSRTLVWTAAISYREVLKVDLHHTRVWRHWRHVCGSDRSSCKFDVGGIARNAHRLSRTLGGLQPRRLPVFSATIIAVQIIYAPARLRGLSRATQNTRLSEPAHIKPELYRHLDWYKKDHPLLRCQAYPKTVRFKHVSQRSRLQAPVNVRTPARYRSLYFSRTLVPSGVYPVVKSAITYSHFRRQT